MPSLATQLKPKLEEIKAATGPAWQKHCLKTLKEVTGMVLSIQASGYEVGYPCYCGHPAEFSLPSRDWLETAADPESVEEWCRRMPSCGDGEPASGKVIDPLGAYIWADKMMGARVELYWGKILATHLAHPTWPLKALAKVVMMHELAHLVTHEGSCHGRVCDGDGINCGLAGEGIIDACGEKHWADFPYASGFTREVLAQMATEDALEAMGSKEQKTLAVFRQLQASQPGRYQANATIRAKLEQSAPQPPCGRNPPRVWNGPPEIFWYQISALGGLAGAPESVSCADLSRAGDEVGFLRSFWEHWNVRASCRNLTCLVGDITPNI